MSDNQTQALESSVRGAISRTQVCDLCQWTNEAGDCDVAGSASWDREHGCTVDGGIAPKDLNAHLAAKGGRSRFRRMEVRSRQRDQRHLVDCARSAEEAEHCLEMHHAKISQARAAQGQSSSARALR